MKAVLTDGRKTIKQCSCVLLLTQNTHNLRLNRYAVAYPYSGTAHRMDDLAKTRFREEIIFVALTFINRAQELTDTKDSDL